ncbi:hypothetical protein [Rhizobium sp. L245/93]|uniref:hypothetical protein n=1 Tax=Rhizobium sp. L245/93 TaxID=2819998 RepID=UPI001ADADAC4|nr:hypothetical protein [Rhizobium sp. L245/93]MBO9168425.1 hypothetical protein [Rhizobium sp. L245/93]
MAAVMTATRRRVLKLLPGAAAAMSLSTCGDATAIARPAPARIPDLYLEWLAIRDRDNSNTGDEEDAAFHMRYMALQARIIAAEPATPRDVAIQFLVDTDDGESDFSEAFQNRIRQMASA